MQPRKATGLHQLANTMLASSGEQVAFVFIELE